MAHWQKNLSASTIKKLEQISEASDLKKILNGVKLPRKHYFLPHCLLIFQNIEYYVSRNLELSKGLVINRAELITYLRSFSRTEGKYMFDIDEEKMNSVISSFQIPAKPEILSRIQDLMSIKEPDIENIAQLISSDIGLSSAILKIINSPFYGMNRRISEIKQAVMMLGLKVINGLVTALLLKSSFKGDAIISLERFWDDALDIANGMSFIGNRVKNEVPVDMLYSIGLFHDCGVPLLALKYQDYKSVLAKANQQCQNSIALEEQYYNTNHAALGYYVASSWHLPKDICNLIALHHELDYLKYNHEPQAQLIYAVLKIAENMIESVKRQKNSADWEVIQEGVLEIVGLSHMDYTDLEDEFSEIF